MSTEDKKKFKELVKYITTHIENCVEVHPLSQEYELCKLWQEIKRNLVIPFDELSHTQIDELWYKLKCAGLTGKQLAFKLSVLDRIKENPKKLEDWVSILLGSLSIIIPGTEAINEFYKIILLLA